MKWIGMCFFVCFLHVSYAQTPVIEYDAKLADSLGADDYGMKNYIMAILKTGPSKETDKDKLASYFKGHMDNIQKMAASGNLVVAGPFGKNTDGLRGIFILNVSSVDEAIKLVEQDPAVSNGVFVVEFHPWYGSAALPMYLETHKRISKLNP
ncbi:MAG TPA: YciI family protein [Ferruginibacter sp.]|nr:YciI family protein [Ferruginibacter sp.]HRO16821.1 YciI family protein [Ferruginibacter sp.]HRQ20193.1 YciI family protein [Ferruginibacter sp.]